MLGGNFVLSWGLKSPKIAVGTSLTSECKSVETPNGVQAYPALRTKIKVEFQNDHAMKAEMEQAMRIAVGWQNDSAA